MTDKQTRELSIGGDFCHTRFLRHASLRPSHPAVIDRQGALSYGELDAQSDIVACRLRELGAGPETIIPICVDRSRAMAIGILGILKAGAAFLPIDPAYPADRIQFMLDDAKASIIISQSFLPVQFRDAVLLDELLSQPQTDVEYPGNAVVSRDQAAYVIYTSGSTGKPKGAILTQGNLDHYVSALQLEFDLTPDDKYLHLASMGFSSSRRHLLLPLSVGATVVIADEDQRLDPVPLFELILREGVTVFDAVPSFQRHCVNVLMELPADVRKRLLNNSLRLVLSASEPLLSDIPRTWVRDFGHPARHFHMLGQTETSGIICVNEIRPEDVDGPVRPVPVGFPIKNTEIYLLNEELMPVEDGEPGEIFVFGAGVAREYLNDPELSELKFISLAFQDPRVESGTAVRRLCRTGDFARLLPDGRLQSTGRQDSQIKIRGNRVELGEVEAVLLGHAGIRACAVVPNIDTTGETHLAAYLVVRNACSEQELREVAARELPEYMRPATYTFIDSIPLNPNGKIDRKRLPAPGRPPEADDNSEFSGDEIERGIARAWRDLLGTVNLKPSDNFFECGGHSLLASRLIARLRNEFAQDLPLRIAFEAQTISAQAEKVRLWLARLDRETGGPLLKSEKAVSAPLSYAQQRIWFLEQLEPGKSTYNVTEAVRLQGRLDRSALREALIAITQRHDILRTSFSAASGQAEQRISFVAEPEVSFFDLLPAEVSERESAASRLTSESASRPFDLSQGPLFRALVIRMDETTHILAVSFHHMITDGWSMGLFFEELSELYWAATLKVAPRLKPLPIQYSDYAIWQSRNEISLSSLLDYWRGQMEGAPEVLHLPTDFQRPAILGNRGADFRITLDASTTSAVKQLCRDEGVTPFMVLLAAYQTLLFRYTHQDQIVVGTPVAGRTTPETESLIGLFVNTLAIRGDLSGNPGFRELLARTRSKALGAFAHQDLPFERLVEVLHPERSLSYSPVFQTMFAFQNAPAAGAHFADLELERMYSPTATSKFDLSLDVYDEPEGFDFFFEYNLDLFRTETIERLAGNFVELLRSLVADPSIAISNVSLCSPAETKALSAFSRGTALGKGRNTITQLFEEMVSLAPDSEAVVWNSDSVTYVELNQRANKLASQLIANGIGRGSFVGIYCDRSTEMVAAVLGVLKAGAAYVPLDPGYPEERLRHMISDAELSVIITRSALRSRCEELAPAVAVLTEEDSEVRLANPENPETRCQPDDVAYVIFTSGSTGKSKGVAVTHGNAVSIFSAWHEAYGLGGIKRHLQMASFSFDVFTGDLLRALCSGACLVLCPSEFLLEPAKLVSLIREKQIEAAEFVPAVIRQLIEYLEEAKETLDPMRLIVVGSDVWQMSEYRRLRQVAAAEARVISSYGVTEATIDSTYFELTGDDDLGNRTVPIGRPFANSIVLVLDENLNPVPLGVTGELFIGGGGVALEYLNRPELTEERFVNLSWQNETQRFYRSGDLARFRFCGNLELLGRSDNQVKIRGFRVELGEVERLIAAYEGVAESVVVLKQGANGDQRLVAYFTTRGTAVDVGEVRSFLRKHLPGYMVPSAFVEVAVWPLSPNGKIDRLRLPDPGISEEEAGIDDSTDEWLPPAGKTEEAIASIWMELFPGQLIGSTSDFFDLGGHSLLALKVVSRLRTMFQVELPLRAVFEHTTVESLAHSVDVLVKEAELAQLEVLLKELEGISDEEALEMLDLAATATVSGD